MKKRGCEMCYIKRPKITNYYIKQFFIIFNRFNLFNVPYLKADSTEFLTSVV